jgi:hypothetical protein
MTTTIKSTDLDFEVIKNNLTVFFKEKEEFKDYDFEGSGLSNILDVLAYNTHYNGLIANFALNESYLTTAQLRPSIVSLAESLGYIPDSKNSAQMSVNITMRSTDSTRERVYALRPGELVLRGEIENTDYTFTNRETLIGTDNGSGIYDFRPAADEESPVIVYEGEERSQKFIVDRVSDVIYVIPDKDMDINTTIIRVYDNQSYVDTEQASEYVVYTNLLDAVEINELSRLYVLREAPNGNFELTFGNGTTIGIAPTPGQVVDVNYLRTKGSEANNIATLEVVSTPFQVVGDMSITSNTRSSGGRDKESAESIRKNAPFQYATQNRMVTGLDYSSLILKKYSQFIKDIKSWGGEDDPEPDYGAVFTSIVWEDNISNTTIANTRRGILQLADDLSVVSFRLQFVDPIETFISTEVFYQFNPSLTSVSQSSIDLQVEEAIEGYFETNTGKFDQVYRRSNMLAGIDEVDPSVLSSRADIQLNRRIFPTFSQKETHRIDFPVAIRGPDEVNTTTIRSSYFVSENKSCYIRNKLNEIRRTSAAGVNPVTFKTAPSTTLQLVDQNNVVVNDDIGYYDPATGEVHIEGLTVQRIAGGRNFIKIFAVPANQSAVDATLNTILKRDAEESFTKAIIVSTR